MNEKLNIFQKLAIIQQELKVPKLDYNKFGKFNYRTLEKTLDALKPLLNKTKTVVYSKDEIQCINNVFFRVTRVMLYNLENPTEFIETQMYCQEPFEKAGMAPEQCSGSAASYNAKYAMGKLFCIDDTDDADATNTHGKTEKKESTKQPAKKPEADYIIPFGKYANRSLKDIAEGNDPEVSLNDIQLYVDYIENQAKHDKKPITGIVKEFIGQVEKWS